MKKSKILATLTATCAITGMLPVVLTTTSCKNYQNNYSQIVQNIVLMLKEMNKNPRCSSDSKKREYLDAVRNFIVVEAIKAGIDYKDVSEDKYGNLWFDVPASEGCDNWQPLIIQGHMDMVVAGLTDAEKPITPIQTEIDWKNGIVHSKNYKTSLGADDGFGICAALAIIQDKTIKHGPLRIFCSADEDSGMLGAAAHYDEYKDKGYNAFTKMGKDFSGTDIKYLLNIDAEEIGHIYRSCAGSITYKFEKELEPANETILPKIYSIGIDGLKGGHSGGDLTKDRANADKCIFELLHKINKTLKIQLVQNYHPIEEKGQLKDIAFQRNQIVSHACVIFNIEDNNELKVINDAIASCKSAWQTKYTGEDWNKVNITIQAITSNDHHYLSQDDSKKYIEVIGTNNPYGTIEGTKSIWYGYISDGKGGYTKSANISPVEIKFNDVSGKFNFKVHSQTRTIGTTNFDEMKTYYQDVKIDGIEQQTSSEYKPWEKVDNNKMVQIAKKAFNDVNVTPSEIDSSGGVEPTWWMQCNPNLNCTCVGATITDAHSTKETLYINTIQPLVDAIKEMLLAMETAN